MVTEREVIEDLEKVIGNLQWLPEKALLVNEKRLSQAIRHINKAKDLVANTYEAPRSNFY